MKNASFNLFRAMLLAIALSLAQAQWCFAQQEPEKQVVVPLKDTAAVQNTATGNITDLTPDAMFIKGAGDAHPTGYVVNANTSYVDDSGARAEKATAKIGHAVIISYVVQGDTRVAITVNIRNAP